MIQSVTHAGAGLHRTGLRAALPAVTMALAALGAGGCNNAGEGALSGAGLGALGGLAIGSMFGAAGTGAAIGAIGGAGIGAVVGDQNERNDRRRTSSDW